MEEFNDEVEKQFEKIKRNCSEIVPEIELKKKLQKSIKTKKPLRIKLGADPSSPNLHIGHSVVLQKLKDFQELGHQVIFLIGDFTAQIGDPTGKKETRKSLSSDETQQNAKTYSDQVFKVLDPTKTQIVFNSQWCNQLKIADILRLSAQMTVARMLERDDFQKRFESQQPISLHEFMYPIMQAYDSVQLRADVELGGSDQRFNILLGREYQKSHGQETQVGIFLPLLEGTDGTQKMSKSLGNDIGITEAPKEIFGKIMSISDELMIRYYEILSNEEIKAVQAEHPRDAKINLAKIIVERFHNSEEADKVAQGFLDQFSKGKLPDDIPIFNSELSSIALTKLMVERELASSLSEARRLISQNAVSIDGQKISDTKAVLEATNNGVLKVGKRKYLKIQLS